MAHTILVKSVLLSVLYNVLCVSAIKSNVPASLANLQSQLQMLQKGLEAKENELRILYSKALSILDPASNGNTIFTREALSVAAERTVKEMSKNKIIWSDPLSILSTFYNNLLQPLPGKLQGELGRGAMKVYYELIQSKKAVNEIALNDLFKNVDSATKRSLVTVILYLVSDDILKRVIPDIQTQLQLIATIKENMDKFTARRELQAFEGQLNKANDGWSNYPMVRQYWITVYHSVLGKDPAQSFDIPGDVFSEDGVTGKLQFNPNKLSGNAKHLYQYTFMRFLHYFAPGKIIEAPMAVCNIGNTPPNTLITPFVTFDYPAEENDDTIARGAQTVCGILFKQLQDMLNASPKKWDFDLNVSIHKDGVQPKWNEFMEDFKDAFARLSYHTKQASMKLLKEK